MKTVDECFSYLFNKCSVDFYKVMSALPDTRLTEPLSIMSIKDMMDMMDIDAKDMSAEDITYLGDKIFMNGLG